MAFILISKNIFTSLFSWARSTLWLRFVLRGRGFSAKLRPYYLQGCVFFGITIFKEVMR